MKYECRIVDLQQADGSHAPVWVVWDREAGPVCSFVRMEDADAYIREHGSPFSDLRYSAGGQFGFQKLGEGLAASATPAD